MFTKITSLITVIQSEVSAKVSYLNYAKGDLE
jgi:hypothetical protein